MRIIVTERIADEGLDYLRRNGFEVDVKYGISREELLGIIQNYDAIIVRSVTKVDRDLIEKGVNLKVAGRAGNGIDNIDVPHCTKKGIIVVNTPESNTMAAAELAIGLAYAIFRNIPQAHWAGKNLDFRRNKYLGQELDGKVVGIIGLGRIGSIVARKLIGANMKAIAYDPYIKPEQFKALNVEGVDLDTLLKNSDYISVHAPLLLTTRGMLNAAAFSKMKKGVLIVNTARGPLIDEAALVAALDSGQVGGAGLDVVAAEPLAKDSPLLGRDNVILSPHTGFYSIEALNELQTKCAADVARVLSGEKAVYPISA